MHIPVLSKETLDLLNIKKGDIIVDATADGGGHLEKILEKTGEEGIVIAIDQDESMAKRLKKKFEEEIYRGRLKVIQGNFRDIDDILNSIFIKKIDGILFDLGMSSLHIETLGRGFSFLKPDEPLLMTYKASLDESDLTAKEILNNWSRKAIIDILKNFGEERYCGRIANAVLEVRKEKLFYKVGDLVELLEKTVPDSYKHKKIHFATKTFQALRIAVNDELNALKDGTNKSFEFLNKKGRMAVISFHRLEDRIVKNFFREKKQSEKAVLLTKKPISPRDEEVFKNPRSRSAKLRVCQKL